MLSLDTGLYIQQHVTAQLVQNMQILQMSSTDLEVFLENVALENPVIELKEYEQEQFAQERISIHPQWFLSNTDWQNRYYDREDFNQDNLWRVNTQETLSDYLHQQLMISDYSEQEQRTIEYLISCLDSDGYFRDSPEDVASLVGIPYQMVMKLLSDIQSLDPIGVGARTLQECLLLQACKEYPQNRLLEQVIRDYLQEIAKNHLRDIAGKLHVSMAELSDCCKLLRTLNPKPGSGFYTGEEPNYIKPDALITMHNDHFEVVLRDSTRVYFETSTYYQELAKNTEDRATRDYLLGKLRHAETISNGIAMRKSNLLQVLSLLVSYQDDFFRFGPGHKNPMKLSDIAEELGIHVSTVSRTMQNKYLQCSWGVFPLNYFLTGIATTNSSHGSAITPEGAMVKLSELIAAEDKSNPLSDDALSKLLDQKYGIRIARRTVNKYRQELGIPDRNSRRVWA